MLQGRALRRPRCGRRPDPAPVSKPTVESLPKKEEEKKVEAVVEKTPTVETNSNETIVTEIDSVNCVEAKRIIDGVDDKIFLRMLSTDGKRKCVRDAAKERLESL